MIYDLNTLEVGSKIARLMLLFDPADDTFSVIPHGAGTIMSIYTETMHHGDDEAHTMCIVRPDRDLADQRWFVSDLLGHSCTVICVSQDEVDQYIEPQAFGAQALSLARTWAYENLREDQMRVI